MCVVEQESLSSLESIVACWLIPRHVGEVLQRIAGKAVRKLFKNDITYAAGAFQHGAGHDAGVEAVVHAMHVIFSEGNTENTVVAIIDAGSTFNSINRIVMLHNMKSLWPLICTYIYNCYAAPARLFIFGGDEILSKEGTTQGDPTSMRAYAHGILPMLYSLLGCLILF